MVAVLKTYRAAYECSFPSEVAEDTQNYRVYVAAYMYMYVHAALPKRNGFICHDCGLVLHLAQY